MRSRLKALTVTFKWMKAWLKQFASGLSSAQEYLCLGLKNYHDPLQVVVRSEQGLKVDVTPRHLFLGYKPLVVAIPWQGVEEAIVWDRLCLEFFFRTGECVAYLTLKKIQVQTETVGRLTLTYYEGVEGRHRFIPKPYQWLNSVYKMLDRKRVDNVDLPGNLYDQVRIAYAVPRAISLVTVFDGQKMNLFPTDLHGLIGTEFYLGSLRIGGNACRQVEKYKRIIISEIDSAQYREAYRLGQRHMMDLSDTSHFKLDAGTSSNFKFPLPFGVGRYRELEVIDHFDWGIHRMFTYRIVSERELRPIDPLHHIHQYYAQWRENRKLSTHYLFR